MIKAHIYNMYEKEIELATKFDEIACALGQLKKKNQYLHNELHRVVDECLPEKVTKKDFEKYLKTMSMVGLIFETFSKDGQYRIKLSPVGNVVHHAVQKQQEHLQTAH